MPINFGMLNPIQPAQTIAQGPPPQLPGPPDSGGGDDDIGSGLGSLFSGLAGLARGGGSPTTNPTTSGTSGLRGMLGGDMGQPGMPPQPNPIQQAGQANINLNTNPSGFQSGTAKFNSITRQQPVSEIIFHDTGGGTFNSAKETLQARNLSYHYLIDRNGSVQNLVPPQLKAFHAKGFNEGTIGVSFVGDAKNPVTSEQYQSALGLTKDLQKQFPTIKSIAGHVDRDRRHSKSDPHGFDFNRFSSESGLTYKEQIKNLDENDPALNPYSPAKEQAYQQRLQQQKKIRELNEERERELDRTQVPGVRRGWQPMSLSGTGTPSQSQPSSNTYIQQAIEGARAAHPDNPVMADIMAAQAIHESGLHSGKPSGLASQYNNYFGITSHGKGSVKMNNKKGNDPNSYATYSSPKESFDAHKSMMYRMDRYRGVREAKTPEEAAAALGKSGYATDPRYGEKILNIYNKYVKPAMAHQSMNDVNMSPRPDYSNPLTPETNPNSYQMPMIKPTQPQQLNMPGMDNMGGQPPTSSLAGLITPMQQNPTPDDKWGRLLNPNMYATRVYK